MAIAKFHSFRGAKSALIMVKANALVFNATAVYVPKERPFPKLMKNPASNAIWLMKRKSAGTLLVEGSSLFNTAEVSTGLDTQTFVDFEGSLTLSND